MYTPNFLNRWAWRSHTSSVTPEEHYFITSGKYTRLPTNRPHTLEMDVVVAMLA
jgi:hypothetical protein